jgi:hypothetical protein
MYHYTQYIEPERSSGRFSATCVEPELRSGSLLGVCADRESVRTQCTLLLLNVVEYVYPTKTCSVYNVEFIKTIFREFKYAYPECSSGKITFTEKYFSDIIATHFGCAPLGETSDSMRASESLPEFPVSTESIGLLIRWYYAHKHNLACSVKKFKKSMVISDISTQVAHPMVTCVIESKRSLEKFPAGCVDSERSLEKFPAGCVDSERSLEKFPAGCVECSPCDRDYILVMKRQILEIYNNILN